MQLVFQDAVSSLNPRMPVGISIAESLRFHRVGTRAERHDEARHYLEVVGLSRDYFDRLPHEFSGGQAQRIGIARALVLHPKLLILDEPVSALDVSIRAQILNLLIELQAEFGLTYVFISHDLSVVKRICNVTAVLYLGKIVEIAASAHLYREPLHPYTQALIQAIPVAQPGAKSVIEMGALQGDVPSPINPPRGCSFHTRCPTPWSAAGKSNPLCSAWAPAARLPASCTTPLECEIDNSLANLVASIPACADYPGHDGSLSGGGPEARRRRCTMKKT